MCGTDDLPSIVGDNGQIIRIIGRSYDVTPTVIQENCRRRRRDPPGWAAFYNKVAAPRGRTDFKGAENSMCCLIDIDNFKRINDTFGIPSEIQVITDIAGVLQSQFQETDVTARV